MIRQWLFASIAATAVCLPAAAAELPDFTELVEAQGPAVVNISTTSSKAPQQAPG